jgi:ParB-like chromosome segregation protein Spo0J
MTQPIDLALGQLQDDPTSYQPRGAGLDDEHLERLRASDTAHWPPLLVAPNETGSYDVIDGFHRLHVARDRQLPSLRCAVVEGAGYPEAFAANLAHGLPLTIQDRKDFAVWLHELEPTLSLRELARRSGLSDKTVKAALTSAESPQSPEERLLRVASAPSDPIVRLVRLARAAIADRTGVNPFARFFFRKSDARQRAKYVSRVLASYADDERPAVAEALIVLGTALIEGARAHHR